MVNWVIYMCVYMYMYSFMVDHTNRKNGNQLSRERLTDLRLFRFPFCRIASNLILSFMRDILYMLRNWVDRNKRRSPGGTQESTKRTELRDKTCRGLGISSNILPCCYVENCAINFQSCKKNTRENCFFNGKVRFTINRTWSTLCCLTVNFRKFRILWLRASWCKIQIHLWWPALTT